MACPPAGRGHRTRSHKVRGLLGPVSPAHSAGREAEAGTPGSVSVYSPGEGCGCGCGEGRACPGQPPGRSTRLGGAPGNWLFFQFLLVVVFEARQVILGHSKVWKPFMQKTHEMQRSAESTEKNRSGRRKLPTARAPTEKMLGREGQSPWGDLAPLRVAALARPERSPSHRPSVSLHWPIRFSTQTIL